MIIDARLRPATPAYLSSTVNMAPFCQTYYQRFGVGIAESVVKQSLDLCLNEMDAAGITLGCAPARWGWGESPYIAPEEVADITTNYNGRFYGAIAVHPGYFYRSVEMIEQFVVNGPVRAVCMEPGISAGLHIDDRSIFPLYELLSEKKIPLFLMTGGANGPDISFANPEHLDKMLVNFPNLTVIGIHGSVPYVMQDIMVALRRPNYFPCPDMYLDNTPFCRPYIEAANGMLQDQFLFGTSYPFIPMKESVDLFMTFGVKDAVMEKIMGKNAARALNLNL